MWQTSSHRARIERESFRGSVGKPRGPATEHPGSGKQLRKKQKVCISESLRIAGRLKKANGRSLASSCPKCRSQDKG